MKYLKTYESAVVTKKVYLAGGWSDWRQRLINDYPQVHFLDPTTMTNHSNWFELEVNAVRQAAGVIAWLTPENTSGFGMTYELGMAKGLNKRYLFLDEQFTDKNEKLNYRWSMQRLGAEMVFNTYEDMKAYIDENNWFGML